MFVEFKISNSDTTTYLIMHYIIDDPTDKWMYSHILSFWETFSTNCIKIYVAKNLEKIFF